MNAARLADGLARRGMPPGEIDSRRRLFEGVLAAAREQYGLEPTHAWWVPGRLEVFGKHTDYCGGHSLVGALPRGAALTARRRTDGRIRIADVGRHDELTIEQGAAAGGPAGGAPAAPAGWRKYALAVAARLADNFPGVDLGADIVFASDLPSASGMSSSSVIVVALATALTRLAGVDARAEWIENIRTPEDEAGYDACIENGLAFKALSGHTGVGTHGGSEDHAAIVCGVADHLSAWRFVPIERCEDVRLPAGWTFVVACSGIAARKTGAARDAYNRLSHEAGALLEAWNRHEPPARSLRAVLASNPAAAARLRALAPPRLHARLDHFIREDARVLEAVRAFREGDRSRLADLSAASQADAEALLHNQVPETVALARSARALGAFAASSFGAGFGGSVWALVDADEAAGFALRWLADYHHRFAGRGAATFLARPGPGMTRTDPD